MEIFFVSLVVFLLSCAGLALGQYFGRDPIHGNCRPGSSGGCALKGKCTVPCPKKTHPAQQRRPS